jgi:hypothetical protein
LDEKKIHIDDLYRSQLGNHTEVPDAAVWESIANRLDNQAVPAAVVSPYKWLWRIAALLLIAGALYFVAKKVLNKTTTATSSISNSTTTENSTTQPVSETTTTSQKTTTVHNNTTNSLPLDAHTTNSTNNNDKATTDVKEPQQVNVAHNTNSRSKTHHHIIPGKANANAGYAVSNTAPTASVPENKPKHNANKNRVSENNTYIIPPVYTYTTPVTSAPPVKKLHAPRFDPNSTGPQTQASVPLSYTQQAWQAPPQVATSAPAQATKNDIPAPATITNPDEKNIRMALPFTFNYGAKLGYEVAKGEYHVNSYVFSPYVQFNITNKLSLVLQPGIKASTINNTNLDARQSYYNITSAQLDSNHHKIQTSIDSTEKPIYGAIKPKYYYTQSHDSIVTSTAIAKKTYYEFELPVLIQYEVVKHLRVYGGIAANFSKIVEVKEQREEFKNITLKDSVILKPQAAANPAPPVPSAYNKFAYSYMPYSQYNAASTQNPASSPVRFSYMIGFNYQVWRRFSLDVLMQGSLSNPNYIYDTRVRSIYQQTHFRISLGYQFGK